MTAAQPNLQPAQNATPVQRMAAEAKARALLVGRSEIEMRMQAESCGRVAAAEWFAGRRLPELSAATIPEPARLAFPQGVPVKTFLRWESLYATYGLDGLVDRRGGRQPRRAPQGQPNLIDVGRPDRCAPPTLRITGTDIGGWIQVEGRSVAGQVELARPNPAGRVHCVIEYTARREWTVDQHQAALNVAVHWFRDIGGFQLIEASELRPIVKLLRKGNSRAALAHGRGVVSEDDLHRAVAAYATSAWHKANPGARKTIERFFAGDDWKKWLDAAPDPAIARDQAARKSAAEAAHKKRMEAARASARAEHERQLAERAAADPEFAARREARRQRFADRRPPRQGGGRS